LSKYNALWEHVQKDGSPSIKLSFAEIRDIIGIEILDAKDKFDIPEKGKMFIETYNDTIIFKEETK